MKSGIKILLIIVSVFLGAYLAHITPPTKNEIFAMQVEAAAAKKRGWSDADVYAFCKLTHYQPKDVYNSPAVKRIFEAYLRGEKVQAIDNTADAIMGAGAIIAMSGLR